MDSEDEFDKCLKKQCISFENSKENANPNINSPFMNKLQEISFGSDDFLNSEDGKRFFDKMFSDVPRNECTVSKKASPKKASTLKKKAKVANRTPYESIRSPRSGLTMFEMMKQTDTPKKNVKFLQERGCLTLERNCPSCDNPMILVQRTDRVQSMYFQCNKRHGKERRCKHQISKYQGSGIFLFLFGLFGVSAKECPIIGL